jgi:p-aminobenzoyl-glutamate transporter AbgT
LVGTSWVLRGQTERVRNNLNPDFKTNIAMNYFFEKQQQLKFVIVDDDGSGNYD